MLTQEEKRRAEEAAHILDSEVFADALDRIEADLCKRWKGCVDAAVREELWQEFQASQRIRLAVYRVLEDVAFRDEKEGVFRRLLRKFSTTIGK